MSAPLFLIGLFSDADLDECPTACPVCRQWQRIGEIDGRPLWVSPATGTCRWVKAKVGAYAEDTEVQFAVDGPGGVPHGRPVSLSQEDIDALLEAQP